MMGGFIMGYIMGVYIYIYICIMRSLLEYPSDFIEGLLENPPCLVRSFSHQNHHLLKQLPIAAFDYRRVYIYTYVYIYILYIYIYIYHGNYNFSKPIQLGVSETDLPRPRVSP